MLPKTTCKIQCKSEPKHNVKLKYLHQNTGERNYMLRYKNSLFDRTVQQSLEIEADNKHKLLIIAFSASLQSVH